MLRIKPFSKSILQFWKKWVKIVMIICTMFINFWDAWQKTSRSAIIFQKFFVFFEGGCYIGSYKLWYNIYDQISIFSFNILIGKSYCCVALLELRFCISFDNFHEFQSWKKNVQCELLILFLMFIKQGCLENVSVDWRIGSVSDVLEIRYGFFKIFSVFTTLLKIFWKVSAIFYHLRGYSHF